MDQPDRDREHDGRHEHAVGLEVEHPADTALELLAGQR